MCTELSRMLEGAAKEPVLHRLSLGFQQSMPDLPGVLICYVIYIYIYIQ